MRWIENTSTDDTLARAIQGGDTAVRGLLLVLDETDRQSFC